MLLIVNRAALLSGSLAAALLIYPMGVSASASLLNPTNQDTKMLASGRRGAASSVWKRTLFGFGTPSLMIAACSWLAVAGFRENKRRKSEQQRIAAALSAALRSGLLDEVERSETPVWSIWGEEDDADSAPKSLVLSRYRVLGYSGELRERAVDSEDLPVRTIVRSDLSGIVTDQDLLLGIPRAVLKTERQPFPWAIATSSPSMEDTPDTGSDSKPYMIPDDLPCATEGLRVQ